MSEIQDEFDPPFEAIEPAECRGPLLFNSPHSGRVYPAEFLQTSRLDLATLRRSEDSFVGELIEGVAARGFPIMRAHFPRCYVDVNREPYELDPRMFDGRLPSFANTRSMRVAGGLGTVARVVGDAQEIYDQRISVGEALRRIDGLYKPYHRAAARVHAAAARFRRRHSGRLPFHAVDHRRPRRAAARRPRARRPLRHELRCRRRRDDRTVPCAASAIRSAATSPMPAASSPSTTAIRPPACMRSSSRSTARSIWTSGATSARASFAKLAGEFEHAGRSPCRDPDRGIAALPGGGGIAPGRNLALKEKGPLTLRERPKSREETPKEGDGNGREPLATALQQHTPRRTKYKCC